MRKNKLLLLLVLLMTAVTGARAAWTGGTYTATANENLGAITVNGDATLTINSDVTVTITGGINVASGTLTVTGPGTLVVNGAKGDNGASGWKGNNGGNGGVAISGNIIVQGGATVTATGGTGGNGGSGELEAGSGGNGGVAFAGTLTYKSGTVTANGGSAGSGGYIEDEEEYASSGSAGKAFANDVDFTQTTGYSVTNGTSTIGSVLNQTKVVISGGTDPAASGFTVTMKDGVKDADKWTVKVGEGPAQALPIGGLTGDGKETVTLQYNGRLKVKGVKATSDEKPAAPSVTEVTTFSELQAALSAGKDVKLMNDIECTAEISITSGALTIDGNGKTLSTTSAIRAFTVKSSATVAFKDLTLTGFVSGGGPAINNSGTTVLDECTIGNCHVNNSNGGGAIENKGKLYAIKTMFTSNYSGEIGGAINNYGGSLYMSGCTFIENYTTKPNAYYGGAIGINMGSEVRLINCAFAANKYGTNTGYSDIGVYNNPTNYTIAGCTGATIASRVAGDIITNASGTATLDYSDLSNIVFTVEQAAKPAATVTTAPTGAAIVGVGKETALVSGGVADGGTLMYAVTTTNTKPASTDGFSDKAPTAQTITASGTVYVWYYVKGDDTHTDSEIAATAIEVPVADIVWDASNVTDLNVYGTYESYAKDGVTLSGNAQEIYAEWYDYGDPKMDGISFEAMGSGGFTFTAPTGKAFTKIVMKANGPAGWDFANLGTGWKFDFDDMNYIHTVTWKGDSAASTVDLLKDAGNFMGGERVNYIAFYLSE